MQKEPKRPFYIYCHTSPSGKRYIGQTSCRPEDRWNRGRGYVDNQYFYRAIKKYGWDNFEHSILMVLNTREATNLLEMKLIAFFDTTNRDRGYNIAKGGAGPLGVEWTDERKQLKSEQMTGDGNPMYGKHHSDATRALMSKNRSGKTQSKEMREFRTSMLVEANKRRRQAVNQYDMDGNLVATYESISDAARAMGGSEPNIHGCCNGTKRTAYGFKWARVGESLSEKAKATSKPRQTDGMRVIQYDLDGNEISRFHSLSEAERMTGIHRDRIGDCCHGGMDSYGGFVWGFENEDQKGADKIAVIQLDLDGNILQTFESLAAASAKTGIARYSIRNCCNGKNQTSNGFVWKYADPNWHEKRVKPMVGVIQLDLNGNEVARYRSLSEAMSVTGQDRHRITECCKGTRQSYRGYVWRYAE